VTSQVTQQGESTRLRFPASWTSFPVTRILRLVGADVSWSRRGPGVRESGQVGQEKEREVRGVQSRAYSGTLGSVFEIRLPSFLEQNSASREGNRRCEPDAYDTSTGRELSFSPSPFLALIFLSK